MGRSVAVIFGLIGGAVVALIAVFALSAGFSNRPPASGEAGVLWVYAQTADGPTSMRPLTKYRLPRPQDFAFELEINGTGPRAVRIEIEHRGKRRITFEDMFTGPRSKQPLDYVLRLDERAPDNVTMVVTIESPHTMTVTNRYPLILSGRSRRFWEKDSQVDGSTRSQ